MVAMKIPTSHFLGFPLLLATSVLLLTPALSSAQTAARPSVAAARADKVVNTQPVKARIWYIPADAPDPATAKRKFWDATIIGRTSRQILLAPDPNNKSLPARVDCETIVGVDFELKYERFQVIRAMAKKDWTTAIRILSAAHAPFYPYLDLPENNAAEGVMELGTTMLKFAKRTLRNAKDDAGREVAARQFEAAYKVFQQCSKARWSSLGMLASIKGCHCLVAMGPEQVKAAARRVEEMEEPVPGDDTYGHYWLLRAEIAQSQGSVTNAMDAAVKSLAFENKDVETFPDALLISADCYEKLGEPHRARDVFFEVAKLFPRTDWGDDALARLETLMDSGKTRKAETASTESSFFGLEEDMNKLADDLIKERKSAKPVFYGEDEEESEVVDRSAN